MWILVAVVLKVANSGDNIPVIDKPLIHKTQKDCERSMKNIYDEYNLLKVNYPINIKFHKNDNEQRYMTYTYQPDYNKPKITTYYYCLKSYMKNNKN